METLAVPFVDLAPSNELVRDAILERVAAAIDKGDFVNGSAVDEFERRFAEYTGREECVGVSSGLDGLRLALESTKLEPGAGVIVPAATFAATFEAVIQAGGRPIPVDVTEGDYGLDAVKAAGTSADASHLLPVHLYGQLADMASLAEVAATRGLTIVEDACQAHGAERDGLRPGDRAAAAAFSFYPSKNLGAMGDAGAVVTDDPELAAHLRALRQHGETRKYHHELVGWTARLDTLQAAVLVEKLAFLDHWNDQRRAAAAYYTDGLAGIDGLRLPAEAEGSRSVWHLYVIRTTDQAALAEFLAGRAIHTGRHYPEPVHLSPAYRSLGYARGDFPVAEALAREGLSLPLYPGITEPQLAHVCQSIRDYFGG